MIKYARHEQVWTFKYTGVSNLLQTYWFCTFVFSKFRASLEQVWNLKPSKSNDCDLRSRSLFCHVPGSSGSGHASPDFGGQKCRDFKKLHIVVCSLRLLYRGYLEITISSQEILKMVNDGLSRFLLGIISTGNFERLLFGLTCSFFCFRPLQLIKPFSEHLKMTNVLTMINILR